ncbi:MAG: nucleoside hydrolase [Phycisphaeraceae bacterium JB051]
MIHNDKPVKLILDTDMGNDIDDALALAMIHSLEARGECELLGVLLSKDNAYAPAMVDAINTFYNRGDVPIGMVQNGATPEVGNFNQAVLEMTDNAGQPCFPTTHARGSYPHAVPLLRRLLAAAEDHSVVIIPIGFSTNLHQLFDSPADEISELDGKDLFEQKVSHVVMMAGCFDEVSKADHREYNIIKDIEASTRFIHQCPRPIYFSGWEVGDAIKIPARSIEDDYRWTKYHPVVEGYKRYMQMPYDRPTFDLTAVLQAVRPDRNYFKVHGPGRVTVTDDGKTVFNPNDKQGEHYFLEADQTQCQIVREVQVELSSQPILR